MDVSKVRIVLLNYNKPSWVSDVQDRLKRDRLVTGEGDRLRTYPERKVQRQRYTAEVGRCKRESLLGCQMSGWENMQSQRSFPH